MSAGAQLNLITDRWLPMRTAAGDVHWSRPADLLGANDAPFVGFAWGRTDFDACSVEFLVGLLSTAGLAADEDEWRALWRNPPSAETLQKGLLRLKDGFNMLGRRAFMQECEADDAVEALPKECDLNKLLVGKPGERTQIENADLFAPRLDADARLSLPAAAMALFALQQVCGAVDGKGHRAGLRGGGPWTTLVAAAPRTPDAKPPSMSRTLWEQVWPNVETAAQQMQRAGAKRGSPLDALPWMHPTQTSRKGETVRPQDAPAALAYWGMPARIRLTLDLPDRPARCCVTGESDAGRMVSGCRKAAYGANYGGGFEHPLSPHYRSNEGGGWLPAHAHQNQGGHDAWIGLALPPADDKRRLARSTAHALKHRAHDFAPNSVTVRGHGYGMRQAFLQGWMQFEAPTPAFAGEPCAKAFGALANALINAEKLALWTLQNAVRSTRPDLQSYASAVDKGRIASRFRAATEPHFRSLLKSAGEILQPLDADGAGSTVSSLRAGGGLTSLKRRWLELLHRAASQLLEEMLPLSFTASQEDLRRQVQARRHIHFSFQQARPKSMRAVLELEQESAADETRPAPAEDAPLQAEIDALLRWWRIARYSSDSGQRRELARLRRCESGREAAQEPMLRQLLQDIEAAERREPIAQCAAVIAHARIDLPERRLGTCIGLRQPKDDTTAKILPPHRLSTLLGADGSEIPALMRRLVQQCNRAVPLRDVAETLLQWDGPQGDEVKRRLLFDYYGFREAAPAEV